jgi:hypothetical protein
VILLPVVFCLIFSGAVSELTGGGFSLGLRKISASPVATKSIELGDIAGKEALSANLSASTYFQLPRCTGQPDPGRAFGIASSARGDFWDD